MKKYLSLLIFFASVMYAATPTDAFTQRILSMPIAQAKIELKDNFAYITPDQEVEVFETDSLAWQPTKEQVDEAAAGNWEIFNQIFACPATTENYKALVYDISLDHGSVTCLIFELDARGLIKEWGGNPADPNQPRLFTKYINFAENLSKLDYAKAKEDRRGQIQLAESFSYRAESAYETMLNKSDGRLNQMDLLLASALSDSDIIDLQATEATGLLVLHPEYHSYSLGGTETVYRAASSTTWSEVQGFLSSVKWLINRGSFGYFETQVAVEKQLGHMELKINDSTNLLSARAANISQMYNAFSEVSSGYYAALVLFALIFGSGVWIYQGLDVEGKAFQINKTYPIAALAGLMMLMPISGSDMESIQSQYQKLEKSGYALTNSWANDLAKVFIEKELKKIAAELGYNSSQAIIEAEAQRALARKQTHYYGHLVDNVCWPVFKRTKQYIFNDYNKRFGVERLENTSNVFGSTSERVNLLAAQINTPAGGFYSLWNGEKFEPRDTAHTLSFCAKAYERYNHARARSQKFETMLNADHTVYHREVEKIMTIQASLFSEWGFGSVLALPLLKHRMESSGKIAKPGDVALGDGEDESLIRDFSRWAVFYMLPGAQSIAHLASTALSPLKKVPYVGDLLVGGGGAAISIFTMGKILSVLPVIVIVLFGSFRLVIIISKIFIFHILTPFLLILVLMNKNKLNDVMSFTSRVFATMLELPIFVFAVYILIVLQDFLSGIGTKMSTALNTIYMESAGDDSWKWLENISYHSIGAILDVAMVILSVVLAWTILFKLHTMVLKVIQTETEETLETITERAIDSARAWNSKL